MSILMKRMPYWKTSPDFGTILSIGHPVRYQRRAKVHTFSQVGTWSSI